MCEHHWIIDPPEHPAQQGRRTVILVCNKCAETMPKITVQTGRQLQAELDSQ